MNWVIILCPEKVKQVNVSIKLDKSQPYDRVDWSFLENIMRPVGFCEERIFRIMMSLKYVTYEVKGNGQLSEPIIP